VVALLLYSYARGNRSSRGIERACREDVTYKLITAMRVPDHSTIAEFRRRHEQALGERMGLLVRHGCGRAVLTMPDECNCSKGMTGCVERRFLLRGSGSIPSSGQGAGGGDRGRGACSGFDRRLPRAYSRSGPGHPGRHRIGSRGSAGLGLSHEHQVPFLNGTGRHGLTGDRPTPRQACVAARSHATRQFAPR
jgi:Transposase domain (DUF772)